MRGKIAQLAGFIDQAGLFLANRAVTNKLHFIAPSGFSCTWDASWNSGRGNSTTEASCIAATPVPQGLPGSSQGHPRAMNLKLAPSRLIWPALKCPPITNVGVSAKRENSSRRVTADALGSESAVDDQSRCAIWQG